MLPIIRNTAALGSAPASVGPVATALTPRSPNTNAAMRRARCCRSGDANRRAFLARSGDDRGGRAGDMDSAALVERIGGGLDLIEQLVGVAVERPGADGELQRSVLDGR